MVTIFITQINQDFNVFFRQGQGLMNIMPVEQVGKYRKYKLLKQIGLGTYGRVFEAQDQKQGTKVAVKIESQSITTTHLIHQCNIYKILRPSKQTDYTIKVPHFYYCATQDCYNVFVMELLGPTLQQIIDNWNGKLPLKTVLYFAQQMISIIEYVHSKHILHRDLKPSNFCMGRGTNRREIFLIDFGISKKYIYRGNQHILMKKVGCLIGNQLFGSINAHNRLQQSRRDDLQSLAYIFIFMAKGTLPWKNKIVSQSEFLIQQLKQNIKIQQLCNGLPLSFSTFLYAVRSLSFEQEPNYEFYKNLFRLSFKLNNFSNDYFQIY